MNKAVKLILIICVNVSTLGAQTKKNDVLTLGIWHFNYPNLDAQKTNKSDQINVLDQNYQNEIEILVQKLAKFKPTIIVIEGRPEEQNKIDSLYTAYLENRHQLGKAEEEQVGFRLAGKLGIKKLYCVDEWGDFLPKTDSIVFEKDTTGLKKFMDYFENNPDSNKLFRSSSKHKSKGIIDALIQMNNPKTIKGSLGNYLIGIFKFEVNEGDFMGVHFQTGRWFNRNLKIFRNIQRIKTSKDDKILVIFGSDHMNLLNVFFDSSPEYNLVSTLKYLK